jgi:mono/diheme cytochrome c family protein
MEAMMLSRFTKSVLIAGAAILAAVVMMVSAGARTSTQEDAAALYKSKCVACHGATAEKKFDATKSDDELIQAVLKGKKMEKPPNMPAFEERGITPEQAKALVAFMKSAK